MEVYIKHLQRIAILTTLLWLSSCHNQFAFLGTEPLVLPMDPLKNAVETLSQIPFRNEEVVAPKKTVAKKIVAVKVIKKVAKVKRSAPERKQRITKIIFAKPIKKIIKVETNLEKIDVTKIVPIIKEEDLSSGMLSISFNEFESHGFEFEQKEVLRPSSILANANIGQLFEKLAKAELTQDQDQVSLAQAAPVKTQKIIPAKEPQELVVFDYSKIDDKTPALRAPVNEYSGGQIPVHANLSRVVQNTIQRELGEVLSEAKFKKKKRTYRKPSIINAAVAQSMLKPNSAPQMNPAALASPLLSKNHKMIIKADIVAFSERENEKAYDLDFRPGYSSAEYVYSDQDGEIVLETSANMNSTVEGRILSRGVVPTKVSLAYSRGISEYSVPLLEMNGFNSFLDKLGLDGREGFILVSLTEQVKNIDVNDPKYEARLFLNDKFKAIEAIEQASYALFIGVRAGNNILTIDTNDGIFADKIVFVSEGEVSFEVADIIEPQMEKLSLYEKGPLSTKKAKLNIDEDQFRPLGLNYKPQKDGLNSYLIKFPGYLSSSRKFLEFDHLADKIFVGLQKNTKEIVLPTNQFIGQIFDRFDIESLEQRCLVQVNLNKPVKEVFVEGESAKGPMAIQLASLDSYGNIDEEINDISEKIFVLGEYQGQFTFKFDYVDGSTQTFSSYCSEDTFLLEHL